MAHQQLPSGSVRDVVKRRVYNRRKVVRDDHLLEEAEQHLPRAVGRLDPVEVTILFELLQQILGEIDRASDEVREEGDEAEVLNNVAHRPEPAAVNVDRVAERLKSVEGDSERQNDLEQNRVSGKPKRVEQLR